LLPFALIILEIGSQELFARAGLNNLLPISASQIGRITGISHWGLANHVIFSPSNTTPRDTVKIGSWVEVKKIGLLCAKYRDTYSKVNKYTI
jgi:hypothetical protein